MPYSSPEKRRAAARALYRANPELTRERARLSRMRRREKRRAEAADYYARNKVAIRAKRTTAEAKAKRSKWQKKRRQEAPHIFRERWLRYQYGITTEEWEAVLTTQGNACAICQSPDPGGKKGWHTDHDPRLQKGDLGYVRGILCRSCNNGLGKFKEDAEVLHRAAEYLRPAKTPA